MLKSYLRKLWHRVRQDPILLVLMMASVAYFAIYYISDPVRQAGILPNWLGHAPTYKYIGWFGYYDQGQYLRLAHTLASFNFHQLYSTYTYGVGYPVVAVPAIWLGFDRDPFVFFNIITFVFTIYATYKLAYKLISPFAGFVAGFGLLFASPLLSYVDIPWNSTVCLFVMSAILLMLTVKNVKTWHVIMLGFLVAWAFAARYADVFFLGPLALASVYRGSLRNLYKYVIYMAIGAVVILVPVLYSQYKVFGSPFRTPYVNHLGIGGIGGSDQGLNAYNIKRVPRSAVALFVGPRLAGSTDPGRGLFIDFFWALAAIPGFVILYNRKKSRGFYITFAAVFIIACVFYLSFRASTPDSLQYGELHYFKMFWPGMAIIAAAFFDYVYVKNVNGKGKYSKS